MTLHDAKQSLAHQLMNNYDDREAENIATMVIEDVMGLDRVGQAKNRNITVSPSHAEQFSNIGRRLMSHEPIQYILGYCWFQGMKLSVDRNVLIPRPETEELVEWVLQSLGEWDAKEDRNYKILDIGTGSGCISIALRKKLPSYFETWAVDINDQVLTVARKNADDQQALVDFVAMDFLDASQRKQLPYTDVIVSNPPYIPRRDQDDMRANVVNFEPPVALFVPNNDPLVFYRAIAGFGKEKLHDGGMIFMEIHETLASSVKKLFEGNGYPGVEVKKDMQGKDRMVKVMK